MTVEASLKDLIDLPHLQALLDSVFELTGITSAIVDLDGGILTASGWQELCARFHRVHPETARDCRHSDTTIIGGLRGGQAVRDLGGRYPKVSFLPKPFALEDVRKLIKALAQAPA